MAYNPFDDVILNDPAYMANGGSLPLPRPKIGIEFPQSTQQQEPVRAQPSVRPTDRIDYSQQTDQFRPVSTAIARFYKLLTPEQETLDQIERDQQLRSLATAQAFTGTEFEEFAGDFDLPGYIVQNSKASELLKNVGYQPEGFVEGMSRVGQFFYGNQRKAFEKMRDGEQLTSEDRISIALAPLDSLDFLFPPLILKKLAGLGLKNVNAVLKSTSDLPEVQQVKQFFGGSPLPSSGIADGPPGMTRQQVNLAPADEGSGPIAKSTGRKEQTKKLIDIIKQNNPDDDLLTISQMIQKYNLEGLAFKRTGSEASQPPRLKDTVKADIQKQIPELYASKTRSVNQKRLDKAFPIIQKVSKDYPDGFTKPEIISELRKIYPKASESDLEQIYGGRKLIDNKLSNTFPFKSFMKEGPSISATREADKAVARIQQYDEFLKNNPPDQFLSPTQAAKNVGEVVPGKKATRSEKITEYARNNPDSAIAKYVNNPQLPVEQQLTSDVLTKLKSEFEVFDDFIPVQTASKLTGISETTLGRAVKNGINGVDEFVQPKRAKGKKEAFIRSYIPAGGPDQSLPIQAKSLLTIDNFRGGLFGSTEQDFMKIMDQYGIIPKKIRLMGEFVDNPKYLKNNSVFEQRMANNREKFFQDQIKFLDRGQASFEDLQKMIKKRNDFGNYAKNLFKDTVRENPVLKKRFLEEYYRVLGKKFGGDEKLLKDIANYPDELFEKQLTDIARSFAGNAAHVTPISRVKGRTPIKGDQFKLSPKLRGKFSNPEFYRVNLGVDNIGRQPRFENIIFKNIKIINNPKSSPKARRKALNRIGEINQEMIDKNMSTLLEFSKKDLSQDTVNKLTQQGTLAKALQSSDKKTTLFLGRSEDMSPSELEQMFADRLEKYILAPELFKLSKQRPKGEKFEDEMFIRGSAPYIVKGFPLDFKKGGAVRMAIGGDPLENINQQQFAPDPAFEGKDFFQEAVDSGNLTAFNPLKLFKVFGKVDAVETPKKKIQTDTQEAPPGTTLPAKQDMQPSDFALKSFTLETIMDPNAPKAARPQDWQNFFKGKAAPEAELRDSGILQYLGDFSKYFPDQKITQQQLVDFYETSPMGNISIKVKEAPTGKDAGYENFVGRPRHQEAGQQPLDEVGTDYREVVVQAGPLPSQDKAFVASGHFSEENVIGFTRVATYNNASGQQVAVIQELQTDMLTQVRKEQERLNALLKRIENVKAKAQRRIADTDEYYRNMGQRQLDAINQQFPPATLQKLQENLSAIKPFPNTAGAELIPTYSKELSDLQKEINKLAEIDITSPNPQTIFGIDAIETQQQKVLDNLLDLTRDSELERDLKGIKVPSTRESDELVAFGQSAENLDTQYGGFKDLELFPPIPFNKQPDYVDLLVKATIKDAQTKGINKVAIMPAEKVNQRWGKNPEGPEGKKFKNLYDQVAVQQLKNIAKKYKGNVAIEQIVDNTKPSKALKFFNRDVDGGLKLNKEDVGRRTTSESEEGLDEFYTEQIRRFVSGGGYRQKDVVFTREIAPGQYQDFYVYADDVKVDFLPLEEGESIKDALIVIEEFNPQLVDMVTLTLDSPQSKGPLFMFKKKDGGTIAKDSLVSVTDIFGQYGR